MRDGLPVPMKSGHGVEVVRAQGDADASVWSERNAAERRVVRNDGELPVCEFEMEAEESSLVMLHLKKMTIGQIFILAMMTPKTCLY